MGELDSCRGGGGQLSFVILVSEKQSLVREKSVKSQGILFTYDAGNPGTVCCKSISSSNTGFVQLIAHADNKKPKKSNENS